MKALRNFNPNCCHHLVSRIANRAFFLTEGERMRFVDCLWRVAKFSFRTNDESHKKLFRKRFSRRMYDVSAVMNTLKQNSMSW